jgi:hypothetical protein
MRRALGFATAVALVLCIAAPAFAGPNLFIVEDSDPVGTCLRVLIKNSSADARTGIVQARVVLKDGKSASQSTRITVGGSDKAVATLKFDGEISHVIALGIIEGPDPIPQ